MHERGFHPHLLDNDLRRGPGRAWIVVAAILAPAFAAGCGKSGIVLDAEATGNVTLNGELARFGRVAFHPLNEGPIAYGTINDDGSYVLRTGRGDLEDPDTGSLASGQYVITVIIAEPPTTLRPKSGGPPEPGRQISPEKYASVDTSPLVKSITPGKNVIALELVSDAAATSKPNGDAESSSPASNPPASDPAGSDPHGADVSEIDPSKTQPRPSDATDSVAPGPEANADGTDNAAPPLEGAQP